MTDSTKKHQIQIDSARNPSTRSVFVDGDISLLENLIAHDVEIDHSCGGFGTCGTCCIQVIEGLDQFSPVESIEEEMKQDRGFKLNERLSCQSYLRGPAKIKIP